MDAFVVMPNHVHLILGLTGTKGTGLGRAGVGSLGAIVGQLKAGVTRSVWKAEGRGGPVWQRGFFEHVVRDERTLERHRRYIAENPTRWAFDRYAPRR